jgi:outer membrane protein assembly complex protein YaeT
LPPRNGRFSREEPALRRAARAARALLPLLALALAAIAPAPAAAQTADLPEELRTISDVRFRGLRHLGRRRTFGLFGPRDLKEPALHTRRPSVLPWRDKPLIRRDYLRSDSATIVQYCRHYGYLDAAVDVRLITGHDPREATVYFDVREGPLTRVGRVELEGVHVVSESDVRHALLSQPGVPFDPVFLQLDVLKIKSLYLEHGFRALVDTGAVRDSAFSQRVTVHYAIDEGPQYRVGRIDYIASGHLRESLARRELLLKTGDVFRRSRLDQSVERLYNTGLYRQVQVSPIPDSVNARMDVQLGVSARPPRWIDGGVGSGTSDRFRTTAQWGHRNLDTRALGGVLDGELSWYANGRPHRGGASATLSEPWLFGVRLLGQAATFYRQQNDLAYDSTGRNVYTQHIDSRGFRFSLFREFSRISRVTLQEETALVHQGYTFEVDTAAVPDTTQARLQAQTISRYRTNLLRATVERDTRNDRISPGRGSYQAITSEFSGGPLLRGQTAYRKGVFSSTWYSPRPNGWLVAFRATGGVMSPFGTVPQDFSPDLGVDSAVARVPRESRFFVGGVNTLRGYAENSVPRDGGLAMMLGNIELRAPLVGPLGVEVFLDAGNVWDRPEYIKARDLLLPWQATRARTGDLRYSYGAGLRLVLPFGPLRIDLARGDRPDFPYSTWHKKNLPFTYQFAIGPSF